MKARGALFVLCLSLLSCSKEQSEHDTRRTKKASIKSPKLKLEFLAIPEDYAGCADLYTLESQPEDSRKLVFFSDMQEYGLIRVNGKLIELKRTTPAEATLPTSHHLQFYEGAGYKLKLDVEEVRAEYESGYYKGKLFVHNGNDSVVIRVHGETGC